MLIKKKTKEYVCLYKGFLSILEDYLYINDILN